MIEINKIRYARTEKEFKDSLFNKGGTASGFYKILKNRIEFFNAWKEPIAALVVKPDFSGIVSMTQTPNGKKVYMFSHNDHIKNLFNIPELYSEQIKHAEKLYKEIVK